MTGALIRAMEPSDVDVLFRWENDPQQWRDGGANCRPLSRADIQAFIDNSSMDIYQERQMRLMICNVNDEPVGCVDLFDFDPFSMHAYIGILVVKSCRNQGYAAYAIDWMSRYAFDVLGMKSLCATMLSSNEISRRLFERCGFQYVGTRKQWYRIGDMMYDELIYQLVNTPSK